MAQFSPRTHSKVDNACPRVGDERYDRGFEPEAVLVDVGGGGGRDIKIQGKGF